MSGMPTYVALLRALNVGGRYYKMADLRRHLTDSGLEEVETYIQTGNVRFRSPLRSRAKVQQQVEAALRGGCGFDVPAIVLTPAELTRVYADALDLAAPLSGDGVRQYVTFLQDEPPAEAARAVDAWDFDGERAQVSGRAVHVWLSRSTHQSKISNARLERTLGVGTTRDLKVVKTLAERWGA
jgi:uncharacterized protein (DUF1697 family)